MDNVDKPFDLASVLTSADQIVHVQTHAQYRSDQADNLGHSFLRLSNHSFEDHAAHLHSSTIHRPSKLHKHCAPRN